MNDHADIGAMQRAAEQRVYEMQRRSDAAVQAARSEPGEKPPRARQSILSALPEPDRLLRSIPEDYLLLAVLALLIAEKADLRLIIAVAYLLV